MYLIHLILYRGVDRNLVAGYVWDVVRKPCRFNSGHLYHFNSKMPKRKVYTISQIVDAFYANEKPEKIKKMAETLLMRKKIVCKNKK